ncbi:uncharacterized protein B0H18DRAFT_1020094, partial [Fomitopsis serialis]|uniref:uncharacterized protein n=1 Tax=Fomitopsis serialis TaxID=139415 RepID=UPI002008B1C3
MDPHTLIAAALVCAAWYPRVMRNLYHTIKIGSRTSYNLLFKQCHASPQAVAREHMPADGRRAVGSKTGAWDPRSVETRAIMTNPSYKHYRLRSVVGCLVYASFTSAMQDFVSSARISSSPCRAAADCVCLPPAHRSH